MDTFKEDNRQLRWVKKTASLLDSKFTIPGTNIRFGIDPVFSLFPVVGDVATSLMSLLLINTMRHHGASSKLVTKMVINVLIDTLIGSIPIVGTIFDIYFKANNRNVKLLREHYEEGKHQGSGKGLLAVLIFFLLLILAGMAFLAFLFVKGLYNWAMHT